MKTSDHAPLNFSIRHWFFISVLLGVLSWLLICITEFNADYLFRDESTMAIPDIGLLGWLGYVYSHPKQFFEKLNAFIFIPFAFPPAAILLSWKVPKFHMVIILTSVLGTLWFLDELLSFEGYNSGNGGYNGAGIIIGIVFITAVSIALGFVGAILSLSEPK